MKKNKLLSTCSFLLTAALTMPLLLSFGGCSPAPGNAPSGTDVSPSEESDTKETAKRNDPKESEESVESVENTVDRNIEEILPFREITSTELVAELRTGWNLGNTLDAPLKGGNPATAETTWGNPLTNKEMFQALKNRGFQTVRIPVTWQGFTGSAPDYTIDPQYLARVHSVVDYAIDSDLYVILNTHHEEWVTLYDSAYEEERTHLTRLWEQIAEEFKGYDEHLIFEDLNEPRRRNTSIEWTGGNAESRECLNRLNEDFVRTVRSSGGNNDKRLLMIPGYAASSSDHVLKAIRVPDDPMIAVSVHAYIPYDFALNKEGTAHWSVTDSSDTVEIDHLMKTLDSQFLQKGIPVILGEVGAMSKDNDEARIQWAKYYFGKASEYGVPILWWDNGLFSGSGETFGLLDRRTLTWPSPELTDIVAGP